MVGILCPSFPCSHRHIFVYFRPADSHKGSEHAYSLCVFVMDELYPAGWLLSQLCPICNVMSRTSSALLSFSRFVLWEAGGSCLRTLFGKPIRCMGMESIRALWRLLEPTAQGWRPCQSLAALGRESKPLHYSIIFGNMVGFLDFDFWYNSVSQDAPCPNMHACSKIGYIQDLMA